MTQVYLFEWNGRVYAESWSFPGRTYRDTGFTDLVTAYRKLKRDVADMVPEGFADWPSMVRGLLASSV